MKVLVAVVLVITNYCMLLVSCQRQQQQQQQQPSRLLRIPRIYNALITTDEELIPSQAYPAVAPVLRPAIPHFGTFLVYNETDYAAPIPQVPYAPQGLAENPNPPSQSKDEAPLYSLQAQQRPPNIFDDRVKNNRNPEIPDVPPPPLPVKPQQQQQQQRNSNSEQGEGQQRRPQDYPPPPSIPFF